MLKPFTCISDQCQKFELTSFFTTRLKYIARKNLLPSRFYSEMVTFKGFIIMRMNKPVPKGGQMPGWVLRVGHAISGPGFDPAPITPEFKYTLVNSRLGVFHPVSYVLFDLFVFTAFV